MTPADPRDGLPELPQPSLLHVNEPREFYTADQMLAYAEQCIAHARPEAVDSLAADQQKGGGEAVGETVDHDGWECVRWLSGEAPPAGTKLYTTPQPSIPAPAQQGDQLDAARWRKLEELVDTGSDRYWYVHPSDGEGGSYDRMKSASHLRQCIDRELAHPPHADQETQG